MLRVKIGDFGMACRLKQNECVVSKTGTLTYMAPEVVRQEPSDFKADVWSLAVILFALISSTAPFVCQDLDEMAELICTQELQFPEH